MRALPLKEDVLLLMSCLTGQEKFTVTVITE